jgi:hypothetical protein
LAIQHFPRLPQVENNRRLFGVDGKPTPEEIELELEGLLREAQDEQADIQRVADQVARAMTETAFREFPVLKNMSAEQFRKFGDAVSRLSTDFAMRAARLADEAEKSL